MFSLPLWAPPKALSDLGNIRNDDISREKLVIGHSEGKEARKLEGFGEFRGSLDKGDRILGGFTLTERTIRYNLIYSSTNPVLNILV